MKAIFGGTKSSLNNTQLTIEIEHAKQNYNEKSKGFKENFLFKLL